MSDTGTQLTQMPQGDHDTALRHMFDFSVQVMQPEGYEHNVILVPLPTDKSDAKYVRQLLKTHHVTPEHQRLIAALHQADRAAIQLGICGPAGPGRLFRVEATAPSDLSNAKHIDDD